MKLTGFLKHASDLSSNTKEIPNKEALEATFQGEFLKEGKFSSKSMIIREPNKSESEGVGWGKRKYTFFGFFKETAFLLSPEMIIVIVIVDL